MTGPAGADHRERLQKALLAIRTLQARIDDLQARRAEPIAIVGVACRLPGGANGAEAFWGLLRDGVDAVTEVPASRWNADDHFDPDPAAPGKTYSRWGAFIDDVDRFDPHFFGISPREAVSIDPQHRLLLEVSWAALESAGIPPHGLIGSRTGVFVGITGSDYAQIVRSAGEEWLDAYASTGTTPAFVAGRLSYVLGLNGPSVAVDTACSSSLAAVHLASRSLRDGECETAIAGGVNLMLGPDMFVTTAKARMLSPAGRCRTFDAGADGFVRGEGCGVVVLKPLRAARESGDPVLAVIRGSAMNQDGASSGITVPNRHSQETVIRDALAAAGAAPHEIQYVEAHGTGTPLGDPIEMRALAAVLGTGREASAPLHVGSVKTNIGHLEAAAGIAGLIKVILMLRHGEIPPHLHFDEPSPHIPWDGFPAVVPTVRVPWGGGDGSGPRLAGVSSFGASGTNVHMIVAEPPATADAPGAPDRPVQLLTLSARGEPELRAHAANLRRHLTGPAPGSAGDICYTASAGRAHFAHRLAISAATTADLADRLDAFLAPDSADAPGIVTGRTRPGQRPKVVFLFTGQGSQYVGMGRQLFQTEPRFRQAIERCDEILRDRVERPLIQLLHPQSRRESESELALGRTEYAQPALFALEYALADLWRSWGIEPAAVLGHSLGEYVAACVAGVFGLEDGLALVAERARAMQALPTGGTMVAVRAGEEHVREVIAPYAGTVSIAAVNGPRSVVISGATAAVEEILSTLADQGIDRRALAVSHAFHSPLVDPALDAIEAAARRITMRPPSLRMVANLTGEIAGPEVARASYWRRHARQPVQFARGIRTLEAMSCDAYVEIGPAPVLLGMAQACTTREDALWLPSLRKGAADCTELTASLARLYAAGAEIDWRGFHEGRRNRVVWLPSYPFRRDRYWIEPRADAPERRQEWSRGPNGTPTIHPLLGYPIRTAGRERIFEVELGAGRPAFLADHRVQGRVVLPATAFLEIATAAAEEAWAEEAAPASDSGAGPATRREELVTELEEIVLHEPLVLPDTGTRTVQIVVTPAGGGTSHIGLHVLEEEGGAGTWRLHASGSIRRLVPGDEALETTEAEPPAPAALADALPDELDAENHYAAMSARGIEFGGTFRGVVRLRRGDSESIATVRLPATGGAGGSSRAGNATTGGAGEAAYRMHPALLDACLQAVGGLLPAEASVTYLPFGFERVRVHGPLAGTLWSRARLREAAPGGESLRVDLSVHDEDGRALLDVRGISLRRVRETGGAASGGGTDGWLYEVRWEPRQREAIGAWAHAGPPLDELLRPVAARADALETSRDAARLRALGPELDRLSASFAAGALQQLGWRPQPGLSVSAASVARELGVSPRHHRRIARMLEILAEDGFLTVAGDAWGVVREPEYPEADALLTELTARFPEAGTELGFLERCGGALEAVLRGARDPLELLFPGGSMADTEHLYRTSILTREFNELVGSTVAALLPSLPADRPLRVLEVGGGTGGTTSHVLPLLPPERTEYWFTDVSPHFTEKAGERFPRHPFVRARTLDIASDPVEQGFAPHSFDLIIAANVLHATPDLDRTLGNVRSLLAPGGMLVLLEGVDRHRFADLTVGLTDGWWCFADDRRSYALIESEAWLDLLRRHGMHAAAVEVPAPFAGQAVLVGRVDAEAVIVGRGDDHAATGAGGPGTWLILADAAGTGRELAARLRAAGATCVLARPAGGETASADATRVDPAARGAGDRAEDALESDAGPDPEAVLVDQDDPAGFQHLLRDLGAPDRPPLRGVVHLWALDDDGPRAAGPDPALPVLEAAQRRATGSALQLVQALTASGTLPRLWLVTRGTQAVSANEPALPAHAPLWGLGQAIAVEHPELRCVRIDLDPARGADDAAELFREIGITGEEEQVALRADGRYVARLVRFDPRTDAAVRDTARDGGAPLLVVPDQPYQLVSTGEKVLENMELRPSQRRGPGPGEVEVEVFATGLAFRDVLNALGQYPGGDVPLGGEFAGVVAAVGAGVEEPRPGEPVIGAAPGAFQSFVTVPAELVAPKPARLSMVQAAALPSAFLTAHYALRHLARLGPGDRVLVHAGAGGVGLAAIQVAREAGAEVFATAGSPAKREFLAAAGVGHVFDSRTPDFAQAVLEATDGRGVDVVLNSLSGEFIPRSLEALAEDGRFVELGKRGIWDPARVAAVRPRGRYHVVDLAAACERTPQLIRTLLGEVIAGFAAGSLRPLPAKTFPIAEAVGAFRYMAQARQIGKVVLVHQRRPLIRGDASYLITGGSGGVGLRVARWLVERGARHLVLAGRRPPSVAARAVVAELEQAGAAVLTLQADVSRPGEVDRLLGVIDRELPPLRGVFHGALVLDDASIPHQSWRRFETVFEPRVRGAWLLHTRTAERPLDLFVLFSAAGTLLGSAGQANYTAANAFLDALAQHRRWHGLPGLSVQWGLWAEVGAAARLDFAARARERGIGEMAPDRAVAALGEVVNNLDPGPQIAIMEVDWPAFLSAAGARGAAPFFAALADEVRHGTTARRPHPLGPDGRAETSARGDTESSALDGRVAHRVEDGQTASPGAPRPLRRRVEEGETASTDAVRPLRRRLEEAPPARRATLLGAHVRRQVAKVLSLDPAEPLDARQPLHELGLDSLMAVELRTLLGSGLELPRALPATLAFDYPTVEAMTDYLLRQLLESPGGGNGGAGAAGGNGGVVANSRARSSHFGGPGSAGGESGAAPLAEAGAELADLTEEEAEAQLRAELGPAQPETPDS